MSTTRERLEQRIREEEVAGRDATAFRIALAGLPPAPIPRPTPAPVNVTVQGVTVDARRLTRRQQRAVFSMMSFSERMDAAGAIIDALFAEIHQMGGRRG